MSEWKTVRLGDVCILEKGQQIDTSLLDDSKPYRYINGGIKESGYFDEFNTSGESVLISEGGASCGYINYVNENFWCGCHCYRLHDIKVFPKYLFHALKANQQRIMALRTGSAMPNIQKTTIQKFELKIHDDSTIQKKVSIMLDKCNELIEKHKQTLEKYDMLIKSRFIEMFGNNPIADGKWKIKKIEDVCEFITKGTTPPTNEITVEPTKDSVPYLKVYNLSFNGKLLFDEKPQYISRTIHNHFARSKVFPNDVLMNIVGPPLGKFALIPENFPECNINQAITIFRAKETIIPSFLLHILMVPETLRPIIDSAVGIRQQNLSLEQCRNLCIPVPPIELQNDFAAFVQQIDKSKFAVQKSLEKAETLYKSLMQEYFG